MEIFLITLVCFFVSILAQNALKKLLNKLFPDPFNLGLMVGTLQAIIVIVIGVILINLLT